MEYMAPKQLNILTEAQTPIKKVTLAYGRKVIKIHSKKVFLCKNEKNKKGRNIITITKWKNWLRASAGLEPVGFKNTTRKKVSKS